MFKRIYDVVDLIDRTAVAGWPSSPLLAVDWAELALFRCPFIPDGHPVFIQPADIGVAAEEPNQFIGDTFKMELLGCEQRKAFGKLVAYLPAKNRCCSGAGAVAFLFAVFKNVS